jgi:hypothetical protein
MPLQANSKLDVTTISESVIVNLLFILEFKTPDLKGAAPGH